jgi:transposase
MREASTPTPTPSRPDDPAALRALLLAAWAERDDAVAERDALAARNERLQHLLQKLQRMQFGRRSEQLTADQLQFAFEEVETSIAAAEAEAEKGSPGECQDFRVRPVG